jgi:hypothetical protein
MTTLDRWRQAEHPARKDREKAAHNTALPRGRKTNMPNASRLVTALEKPIAKDLDD